MPDKITVPVNTRNIVFITHANPEDNPFAIWLGAKLASAGYEVWADVLRIRGGHDWQRKLEDTIRRVIASDEVRNEIRTIGIKECARESGFDRKNFVRKLVRGLPVKRNSYEAFVRWLETYKSKSTNSTFQVTTTAT